METIQENEIVRTLSINAPIEKVWAAIGTPEGFEGWFSAKVEGEWAEGNTVTLRWKSGNGNEIILKTIRSPDLFAYQWHPGGYDKIADYPLDQLTTVTMTLRKLAEGTELRLNESGFDRIPDDRRLKVLGMNTEGWDEELENIRKYVEG